MPPARAAHREVSAGTQAADRRAEAVVEPAQPGAHVEREHVELAAVAVGVGQPHDAAVGPHAGDQHAADVGQRGAVVAAHGQAVLRPATHGVQQRAQPLVHAERAGAHLAESLDDGAVDADAHEQQEAPSVAFTYGEFVQVACGDHVGGCVS